jgi:hypothetical protein
MSNSNILIPVSDEHAKAIQEALKTLQGFGGFLRETFGTVLQDVVGLLGGDWLKVRRAENLARILDKARERLRARRVEAPNPRGSHSATSRDLGENGTTAGIELVSCRELLATSKMLLEGAGSKSKATGCRIKRAERRR